MKRPERARLWSRLPPAARWAKARLATSRITTVKTEQKASTKSTCLSLGEGISTEAAEAMAARVSSAPPWHSMAHHWCSVEQHGRETTATL